MGVNSLLNQIDLQEFSEFIEAIPYLKNYNFIFKNIDYKKNLIYNQAILNSLISRHYIHNIYSIIDNKINISKLKYYVRDTHLNILINIRHKYFENTFRYIAGYQPNINDEKNYYMYSQIIPTDKQKSEYDFIYAHVNYYENYFIPDELILLSKSIYKDIMLSIPVLLKHYLHIKPYLYDPSDVISTILNELNNHNCPSYANLINSLDVSNNTIRNLNFENHDQYFYILYAYYLQKGLNLKIFNIDVRTQSIMMYSLYKNKNLDTLPLNLPDVTSDSSFEFNDHLSNYTNKTATIPVPPPFPDDLIRPNSNKIPPPIPPRPPYINKDFDTNKVIIFPEEKFKNYINKHLPNTKSNKPISYLDELKEKLKNIKNYFGGDRSNFNYAQEIANIDNQEDPIAEKNKSICPTLTSTDYITKMTSLNDFISIAFEEFILFDRFISINNNKKKLTVIYEIIQQSKNYVILTYEFNSYQFKIFSLNTLINELSFVQLYKLYFKLIKDYVIFLNNNENIFSYKEVFIQLSALILKQIDIFALYSINNVLGFRYYISGYYNLLKLINSSNPTTVSLFSGLLNVINSFHIKVVEPLIGGCHLEKKMFELSKFEKINFFHYVYLFDIVNHLTFTNSYSKADFYNCEINDTYDNNEIYKFFDGIPFTTFLNINPDDVYILNAVNKLMFIGNIKNDSKMLFKYSDSMQNVRVCLLIKQITQNYNAYDLIKELSYKIRQNNINVQDLETFLYKFNMYIDKISINNLLRKINKIQTPKEMPILMSYFKEKEPSSTTNTLIELFLFLFNFISKLGFKIDHFMTKSNLVIRITPEFNKENIQQYLNENNPAFKDIAASLIKENQELFDFIINSTIKINIEPGQKHKGGGSKIIFRTPSHFTNIENSISDNIINLYKDNETIENNILTSEYNNIFEKEKDELHENLAILFNTKNVNIDNLYKIIPKYIVTQTELFHDIPVLFNKHVTNTGGIKQNIHPIKVFLDKYSSQNYTNTTPPVPQEYINKNIDSMFQEQYFKSLDKLVIFYDNQLLHNQNYNPNSVILRNILNSMEYLRKYYKVDFTHSFKYNLIGLMSSKQKLDEVIYQVFIVIQYIKHFVIYLYQKLGINFEKFNLDFTDFSTFYKIIKPRFQERDKIMSQILNTFYKNASNKLNVTELDHEDLYNHTDQVEEAIEELFTNPPPTKAESKPITTTLPITTTTTTPSTIEIPSTSTANINLDLTTFDKPDKTDTITDSTEPIRPMKPSFFNTLSNLVNQSTQTNQ